MMSEREKNAQGYFLGFGFVFCPFVFFFVCFPASVHARRRFFLPCVISTKYSQRTTNKLLTTSIYSREQHGAQKNPLYRNTHRLGIGRSICITSHYIILYSSHRIAFHFIRTPLHPYEVFVFIRIFLVELSFLFSFFHFQYPCSLLYGV